jgi:hypothetical protein
VTDYLLRKTMDAIRDAGGVDITVTKSGHHRYVEFTNPAGERQACTLHLGGKVKSFHRHAQRSQLRRMGLEVT